MLREEKREGGREGRQMRSEFYMKNALAASLNEMTFCYLKKRKRGRKRVSMRVVVGLENENQK